MPETADDDFCPNCWARRVALDLLESAIYNALAADCDVEDIVARFGQTMDEACGVEEPTAAIYQPAAGSA